jgi:hypothetical protein
MYRTAPVAPLSHVLASALQLGVHAKGEKMCCAETANLPACRAARLGAAGLRIEAALFPDPGVGQCGS